MITKAKTKAGNARIRQAMAEREAQVLRVIREEGAFNTLGGGLWSLATWHALDRLKAAGIVKHSKRAHGYVRAGHVEEDVRRAKAYNRERWHRLLDNGRQS